MWILLECRQKKLMIKKKALKIKKTPMSQRSEVITHEGNSWNISLYSYNTLGESDASSTVSSGITESFGTQQRGLDFKTLWSDYGSDVSHTDPKTGKEIFGDYCAINLSEALIKSGVSMNYIIKSLFSASLRLCGEFHLLRSNL